MGKGLHKVFKAVANKILQVLPILGEYVSEVSYFSPDPRNFTEASILPDEINKPSLK